MAHPATPRQAPAPSILRALEEVHRELGPGFGAELYREALAIEFRLQGIDAPPGPSVDIWYDGRRLPEGIDVDHDVAGVLLLVAAVPALGAQHEGPLMHALRATGRRDGVLVNFGATRLQLRRLVWEDASRVLAPAGRPARAA